VTRDAAPESRQSRIARLLERLVDVRAEEVAALAWAWLYIFSILSSYYILRPIRDQMGIAGGVDNLPWLFTGTLVGMIAVNVPYGYLVRKLPRRTFIAITYRFFAINILLFAVALHVASPAQEIWIGRVFFIWTSVFNLFVVSIFWAMVVDVFNQAQGKRLFGFIAAGATLGATVGSAIAAGLAAHVSASVLLVGAAVLIEVAVFAVGHLSRFAVNRQFTGEPAAEPASDIEAKAVGGGIFAGFTKTFRSAYLLNTGVFLLLYALTSTLLYFEQVGIVSQAIHDRGAQRAFFASVDLAVNILTLAIQLFFTGRIMRALGVAVTLALLPALSAVGFAALGLLPTIGCVVGFQVLRRAGNFAVARPAREVLFTVVPREDRYKAKSFIDTVVYRTGDQIGAWSFELVRTFGWSLAAVALAGIPLSLAWLANGFWLGRRQEAAARAATAAPTKQPAA
jgi:AAA family ATP:ADP antiporter